MLLRGKIGHKGRRPLNNTSTSVTQSLGNSAVDYELQAQNRYTEPWLPTSWVYHYTYVHTYHKQQLIHLRVR